MAAYLSGAGVRLNVLEYERPMTPAQANALREQVQELNKKRQANPTAFPPKISKNSRRSAISSPNSSVAHRTQPSPRLYASKSLPIPLPPPRASPTP
jgi:hypothetical protein